MGWYTDVVVHVSILEDDDEQDSLRLLPELQAVAQLFPVPDVPHIYAGTTKESYIDKILEGIGAIKWEYPEKVNRDYLETYAWRILGPGYINAKGKTLSERINVEECIERSLEEREALYMKLNNVTPPLSDYWQLSAAKVTLLRQQIGRH